MGDTATATIPTLAAVVSKLDTILAELHEVRRAQSQFIVPVDVLTAAEAARRIGVSERTLRRRYVATGVLSDAREPGRRGTNSPRQFYADEIEVLKAEGEGGVRRLREQLGRAT